VYALLSGRTKGRRGDAHRAALALGLKRPVRASGTFVMSVDSAITSGNAENSSSNQEAPMAPP
jgi:hypothetical protein